MGWLIFIVVVGTIAFLFGLAVRAGRKLSAKQEAYFVSMFPDLQPYYHPKNVLEFVRARLAQPPARSGMSVRSPPGFPAAHEAQVSFDTDKKGRERETWRLLDAAGKELSRFFFQTDEKDGMVRVGDGKFRVSRVATVKRVRYWHPDREFKWTPDAWKFVTRVFEQPVESSDSGLRFGDSSPSSSSDTARTAAAAAGIAAAGGAFDGGGASATWSDGGRGDGDSGSSGTAGATSY